MQHWYVLEIRKVAVEISASHVAMFEDFDPTSGTKMRLKLHIKVFSLLEFSNSHYKNPAAQSRAFTGSLRSGAVKGNTNVGIIVDTQP